MKQIKDYIGRTVRIELSDTRFIIGVLAFYHFDNRTIHLNDYIMSQQALYSNLVGGQRVMVSPEVTLEKGPFKVINADQWRDITG